MNDVLLDIGGRLRKRRKTLTLTQSQCADKLKMSLNFYGDIERGRRILSIEKILLVFEE